MLEKIVREAGDAAHGIQKRGNIQATNKAGEALGVHFFTEADKASEEVLIQGLKRQFPRIPIVSEEQENQLEIPGGNCFLIDPIDGTTSFMNGSNQWGVLVTQLYNWVPKVAIIYCPALQILVCARGGVGCFLNNKQVHLGRNVPLDKTILSFEMGPWLTEAGKDIIPNVLTPLLAKFAFFSFLSGARDIVALLQGEVGGWVNLNVGYPWDYAPLALCMEEVGGYAVSPDGSPLLFQRVEKMGIVAAANQEMLNIILPITKAWSDTQK